MTELPESVAGAPRGPTDIDLFMTVVKVADWSAVVAWYRDTLGLDVALLDLAHEFALLRAGGGRLGLQGTNEARVPDEPTKVRLVFQVRDVNAERNRLIERGVEVSMPIDNTDEGYREIRLHDPHGNSLALFSWVDAERGDLFARDRH